MVRVEISTSNSPSPIRIGFTDQRLTAHGGMVVWSHFLQSARSLPIHCLIAPRAPTRASSPIPPLDSLAALSVVPTSSPAWRG